MFIFNEEKTELLSFADNSLSKLTVDGSLIILEPSKSSIRCSDETMAMSVVNKIITAISLGKSYLAITKNDTTKPVVYVNKSIIAERIVSEDELMLIAQAQKAKQMEAIVAEKKEEIPEEKEVIPEPADLAEIEEIEEIETKNELISEISEEKEAEIVKTEVETVEIETKTTKKVKK